MCVLMYHVYAGKKWIDAAVDLPFALPTSVAGLTLATVYGEEGILGRLLMGMGINVVYTRLGVAVAMIFVSFPFVVRTMQPVLQVSPAMPRCVAPRLLCVPCFVYNTQPCCMQRSFGGWSSEATAQFHERHRCSHVASCFHSS